MPMPFEMPDAKTSVTMLAAGAGIVLLLEKVGKPAYDKFFKQTLAEFENLGSLTATDPEDTITGNIGSSDFDITPFHYEGDKSQLVEIESLGGNTPGEIEPVSDAAAMYHVVAEGDQDWGVRHHAEANCESCGGSLTAFDRGYSQALGDYEVLGTNLTGTSDTIRPATDVGGHSEPLYDAAEAEGKSSLAAGALDMTAPKMAGWSMTDTENLGSKTSSEVVTDDQTSLGTTGDIDHGLHKQKDSAMEAWGQRMEARYCSCNGGSGCTCCPGCVECSEARHCSCNGGSGCTCCPGCVECSADHSKTKRASLANIRRK